MVHPEGLSARQPPPGLGSSARVLQLASISLAKEVGEQEQEQEQEPTGLVTSRQEPENQRPDRVPLPPAAPSNRAVHFHFSSVAWIPYPLPPLPGKSSASTSVQHSKLHRVADKPPSYNFELPRSTLIPVHTAAATLHAACVAVTAAQTLA